MNLAIVGAGWAGLAAAVRAADLGHHVTVYEASHTVGGRARRVHSSRLATTIDNGQHIMLGAYRDTLALMQRLGIDTSATLVREPLAMVSVDDTFHLALARAPAPFHLGIGLARAKGMRWREKWHLARAVVTLQANHWKVAPHMSVQQWLDSQQQSPRACSLFWQPLCVGALNTPLDQACAQLFANVLRDSLGSNARSCDVLLPRVDLSRLWPDAVETMVPAARSGNIALRRGTVVTTLNSTPSAPAKPATSTTSHDTPGVHVNGEHYDAVILACNIPSTLRLLRQLPSNVGGSTHDASLLLDTLSSFEHSPIATVTLQLQHAWRLPRNMMLLHENRDAGHYGQWLFNCAGFMLDHSDDRRGTDASRPLVHVVISDAGDALQQGRQALFNAVRQQLIQQTHRFGPMPTVVNYEVIAEKRATFLARPGSRRPAARTAWPAVWLAGDWTDTGYPAVLEGAVRSGNRAARALHQHLGARQA